MPAEGVSAEMKFSFPESSCKSHIVTSIPAGKNLNVVASFGQA
jgi:hypothetical protein